MALLWFLPSTRAAATPAPLAEAAAAARPDSSLRISLITCWPGSEIYELYGHSAIRVQAAGGVDSVWNYGLFDFNRPHFVYRFVKGETDYMVGGCPFTFFIPEYLQTGRRVVEQVLNLTPQEASAMRAMLRRESLPDMRTYRYNYVRDNCATRIIDRLEGATHVRPIFNDSLTYGTYRNEMRAYNRNYPWYQFGIDLVLGSGLDHELTGRDEMFVPLEMMQRMQTAHFSDGRPVVKEEHVIVEGRGPQQLPPTPWLRGPMAVALLVLAVSLAVAVAEWWRRRIVKWWNSLFFCLTGVAGCLVCFLVFFSSHEATSPNMLAIWLNPLQLIAGACLWRRTTQPLARAVAFYNIAVIAVLLAVWPMQRQSADPAVFPWMASALILSATYAIIAYKESYNRNEPISNIGADKSRRVSNRASGKPRKAAPRGRNRR